MKVFHKPDPAARDSGPVQKCKTVRSNQAKRATQIWTILRKREPRSGPGPRSLQGEGSLFGPFRHIQKWLWDFRTLLDLIPVSIQTKGTKLFQDFNTGRATSRYQQHKTGAGIRHPAPVYQGYIALTAESGPPVDRDGDPRPRPSNEITQDRKKESDEVQLVWEAGADVEGFGKLGGASLNKVTPSRIGGGG